METTEPGREEKPFKCPDCPESYETQQMLDEHRFTEHGVKK